MEKREEDHPLVRAVKMRNQGKEKKKKGIVTVGRTFSFLRPYSRGGKERKGSLSHSEKKRKEKRKKRER